MLIIAATAAAVCAACMVVMLARVLRGRVEHASGGVLHRTATDLAMLFIFVTVSHLRIAAVATIAATLVLGWILGVPWPLCVLLAASLAMAPRIIVGLLHRRWRSRLTNQLPDALSLWAGLLKAGQAMAPALSQLAARQSNPLGAELRLVLSQYRLGVGLDVAVGQLRDRASVPDLRMLATMLRAQRELGGNLAESLERLATRLRSRLAVEARIRSLTAQGRLQGVVVGALPVLLALVLAFMEPEAMKTMVTTRPGWAAIALVVVLELTGFAMIRRIVNIDV